MLLIAAFLRATALVIAGYFVWFASSKSEDRLKTIGKYIAVWCFAFAAVLAVAGIAGAFMHAQGRGFHGRPGMHGGMMHRGMMHGGMGSGMMRGGMGMRPHFFFRGRGPESKTETPAASSPATPEKAAPAAVPKS